MHEWIAQATQKNPGLVEPQISTIVQPIDRMAEESVKSLCELINGKKVKNKKSILIPEFRKGGTTV